ncbi:Uncharacterized protein Y057_1095 [Fusarium fujikuroi]|nr:Uncharacterized protein Y057_1095 [Fusarium fujikuroi]
MYPLNLEPYAAGGHCAVAICLGETPLIDPDNVCDLVKSLQEKFTDIAFLICDEIHKYEMMIPRNMTITRAQRLAIKKGDDMDAILNTAFKRLRQNGQLSSNLTILRWSQIEDQDYQKVHDIMYQYRKNFDEELRASSGFYIKRRLAVVTLTEERLENFTKYTLAELPVQLVGFNYDNRQYTTIFHPVYPRKNPDGSAGNVNSAYVSPIDTVVQAYRNNSDVVGDISRSVPHMEAGKVRRVFFDRPVPEEVKEKLCANGLDAPLVEAAVLNLLEGWAFDDQLIGYDDEETFADKKAWAGGYCFGGTMIWSIDFQPSDNSTDGYVPALPDLDGIGAIPKDLQDKWAEQWADAYIKSQKDNTNWAQNLYRNLFEKKDHTKFSCVTPNSQCDFEASCAEFNKVGKGGLYYLFQSMSSFHTFMKALNQQYDSKITLPLAAASEMRLILDIKSGLPQTTINIGSVLGSAFSMANAIAAPLPGVGGPLAGISGLASMIRTFTSTVGGNDNAVDATDTLTFAVKTAAVERKRKIADIVSSEYGDFGHAQADLPKTMLVGGADNPAIKALGYGAWLRDSDLTDLSGAEERMSDKMNQALLWQMAIFFKGFYVVIRDDLPINRCTHPNNTWDDRTNRCVDILSWWPKSASGRVGSDLAMEKVWAKWNMSPLWTLLNAVECWENNGGKIGDAKVKALQSEWANGVPLPCFFAMPVLKGNWSKDAASDGAIWLAGDFVGQEGQDGRLWPKDKCDKANKELDPITGGQVKKCSSLNKVGGEE